MTVRALIRRFEQAAEPLYGAREARQIALLIAAELTGTGHHVSSLLADPERTIALSDTRIEELCRQLAAAVPVQYILGRSEFYGRSFRVDRRVLIPRPETEELVDWICREERTARRLLDVGTGSGAIAVTLALELPDATVSAVDLSADALAVARTNAEALGATVAFRQGDALNGLAELFGDEAHFDLIVSNPPYVPEADKGTMHRNVLDYEPHLALFVPDEDPLRFYRAIARAGRQLLTEGGRLYFEIYSDAAEAMQQMLVEEGYTAVTLRRDLSDKPRMICCRKNR